MRRLLPTAAFLTGIVLLWAHSTDVASAQSIQGVIDSIAEGLNPARNATGNEIGGIFAYIASLFIPLVNIVAILVMVTAGLMMTFSQDESHVALAQRVFLSSLAGVALVYMAAALRNAVIGPTGTGIIQSPDTAVSGLGAEIVGIIEWVQIPLATIALLMIIISGLRAVANYGNDEGVTQLRRTVFSVIAGLVIISIKYAITGSLVVERRPDGLIAEIIRIVSIFLSFLGLVAVLVIILAAFYMIFNLGSDEQYGKAKSLVIRVAIGLVVIAASLAVMNFVFLAATA